MIAYSTIDIEKTNFWLQKAIAYAREKENLDAEARCLARRGLIFSGMREKDSAAVYMDKALKVIEGNYFFATEKIAYEQYGLFLKRFGDYENALNAYLKALDANEKDKAKCIADNKEFHANIYTNETSIRINIANIHTTLLHYDKAIEQLLFTKKLIDENKHRISYLSAYEILIAGNLAETYLTTFQYDKAFPFIQQYHELAVASEDPAYMLSGLRRLSNYYRQTGDLEQALDYAKQLLQLAEKNQQSCPYQ